MSGYFRELGAVATWDTNLARSVVLLEVAKEFADKFSGDPASLPLICSACPGWICYAEKTQTQEVLDHISVVRSPQQVMGALVKGLWASAVGKDPLKVFHVTIMPCFDKKLEASRTQFADELTQTKDVDCVITAMEVDQMMSEESRELRTVSPVALSELLSSGELTSHEGSSAGGYADFVLRYMASSVYNSELTDLHWKTLRNADLQEASLTVGGEEVVKVCRAYGFRNLQNIVQKVKRGKSAYHYVEVMACPGGCLNGGAQLRPDSGQSSKELLGVLQEHYSTLPVVPPMQDVGALTALKQLKLTQPKFTHTDYKIVEKNVTALGIKW
ncbi:Iron hydrogenase large subunit C-terminal [Trinorchestia longiramus]|nr:Iron hydrogenase large subunit C-terminal [Trinorchestia longiramus]